MIRKFKLLLLLLVLFWSCKRESQIIIVSNFNDRTYYSNIDSIDVIPKSLDKKFSPIEMRKFDAVEVSERHNLVKLDGEEFRYILNRIFVTKQEFIRKNLGKKYVDDNENRYSENTELYACGKFEVEKGITTFLVLVRSTDKVFNTDGKYLYLFNVKKDQLCSLVEISAHMVGIDSGLDLKAYRINALFYISDLKFKESKEYLFMPKEIRSKLGIQKEYVKILDYTAFVIEDDGRIHFTSI